MLESNGMSYPDFFPWTRSLYPILINLFGSASQLNLVLSSFSVILSFFVIRKLFGSNFAALGAATVLAVSYNHIVWSGFILTEPLSVFLLFLTILFLIYDLDLLLGLSLAFLILTRYEFVALIFPIIIYLKSNAKLTKEKLLKMFLPTFLTLSLFAFALKPWPYNWGNNFSNLQNLWLPVLAFLALVFLAAKFNRFFIPLSLLGFVILCFYTQSARIFFQTDFLLGFLALIGLVIMARVEEYRGLFWFVILNSLIFGYMYYQVNPEIQRYWTNIIPLLLIPVGVAIQSLIKNKFLLTFIILIIILQARISFFGISKLDDGIWFEKGYEENSAVVLKAKINKNDLLITSFPEPYYYFTKNSTQSLAPDFPYLYISENLDKENVVIVQDMGMRDQFPQFSQLIDEKLNGFLFDEYNIASKYRYEGRIESETKPIRLYRVKLSELKVLIRNTNE